jgi:hypothetical protein
MVPKILFMDVNALLGTNEGLVFSLTTMLCHSLEIEY